MRKRMQKLMSLLLTLSMLLSLCSIPVYAAGSEAAATVYVSATGSDDNDGSSAEQAVKTMKVAYQKLDAAMDAAGKKSDATATGEIIVVGTVAVTDATGAVGSELTGHAYKVAVTGQGDNPTLSINGHYNHIGPTSYDNITIHKAATTQNQNFTANGYPLTIGSGVKTTTAGGGYYLIVGGKFSAAYEGDTEVNIASGTWGIVYGGCRSGAHTGNSVINITGGEITTTVTANMGGLFTGDTNITIQNATVKDVYGGNSTANGHEGDTQISITDSTVTGSIYAAGHKDRQTTGNVTVNVKDSSVTGIIQTDNIKEGAATVNLTASAGETLSLTGVGALAVNSLTGGGALELGSSANLTIGEISGKTALTIKGGAAKETTYVTVKNSTDTAAFTDGDTTDALVPTGTQSGSDVVWTFAEPVAPPDPPAGGTTIYVSATGSDDNDGSSAEKAVATMKVAYQKLDAAMDAAGKKSDATATGEIIVVGTVAASSPNTAAHAYTVLVKGQSKTDGLSFGAGYMHVGPTKYQDITLTNTLAGATEPNLVGGGYALTMGTGITTVPNGTGYYLSLVGGLRAKELTGDTVVTVQSGTWQNIYAGNRATSSSYTMTGDATLVLENCTVKNNIASNFNSKHTGAANIIINNATVKNVYGGNSSANGHEGLSDITIKNSTVSGGVYAGGNDSNGRVTTGNIKLSIADSSVAGTIVVNCTGTATVDLTASAGETLSLIGVGALAVNSLTGGGTLVLGSSANLTVASVTGTTALKINGGAAAGVVYITAAGSNTAAFTDADTSDALTLSGTVNGSNVEWKFTDPASGGGSETPVPRTIFVNTETGNNSNAGTSENAPKKTVKGAYAALASVAAAAGITNDADAVIDIIVDGNDVESFKGGNTTTGFSGTHAYTVRITGKDPTDSILIGTNFNIPGPTEFDNITLDAGNSGDAFFNAKGYNLTIGKGVTTTHSGSYYLMLAAGQNNSNGFTSNGDMTLTVNGGTWRRIFLAPRGSAMTGNITLNIDGATVEGAVQATYNGGTITGDVVMNIADSTIDGVINADCTGTSTVNLTASAGKTLDLSGVSSLAVNSFTGGGNLVLDRSAKLTIDSLTGSTALKVNNAVSGQTFITVKNSTSTTAFTDAVTTDDYELIATASGADMLWSYTGGPESQPIKFTVPSDVTLTVYEGYSDSTPMPTVVINPGSVSTEGGITTYVFPTMVNGTYCYIAEGEGYYRILKNFNISEADMLNGKTINADPGKMAGTGYEPTGFIVCRPDEVMEKGFISTPTAFGEEYEYLFDTPIFGENRAAHQFTTQEEMMAYVRNLDDANDNLYLYILGLSPQGREIPLLLFSKTDLTGKTLEEAAAILREQDKPMIHCQAVLHGCEPSTVDGALMISHALDSAYGDEVLDDINIYVIPRVNVDGAANNTASQSEGFNLNRDHFHMQTLELEYVHGASNLFMPDVALDLHEFQQTNIADTEGVLQDVLLASSTNNNIPAAVNQASWDMTVDIMVNRLGKYGLRAANYGSNGMGDPNPTVTQNFYSFQGVLGMLVEIPGHVTGGREGYARRAFTSYATVVEVIDYVIQNAEEIQKIVEDARLELITKGATYEEDTSEDWVVVKHKDFSLSSSKRKITIPNPRYDYTTGEVSSANATKQVGDYVAEKFRTRPTAYVIPKSESWAADVVDRFVKNGISYYELGPTDAVKLQQYSGTAEEATLGEEKIFVFDEGAYVFPMNQIGSNIIAFRMEPDLMDGIEYPTNLIRSGFFTADGGTMPIYRYIHDLVDGKMTLETLPAAPGDLRVVQPATLGADAKITGLDASKLYEYKEAADDDYKAVPAGSTEITGLAVGIYSVRYAATANALASYHVNLEVIDSNIGEYVIYVGGANASDGNNGLIETKAVATLNQAYVQLAKIMANAPAGTDGKIVFLGEVVVEKNGNDANNVWNSLPAHDYKVTLTGKTGSEGIKSGVIINLGGDTELKNMTITSTASGTPYISAGGYNLVIGEDITSVANGTTYYGIVGGGKTGISSSAASTNVVVQSGTWKEIFAGGFTPGVTGDAKLTVTGGTVTGNVYAAYNGDIGGSVTISLSGNTVVKGTVYGAHQYTATGTSDKVVQGDVTIILGEGAKVNKVYGGGLYKANVKGTANIIVDGAAQFGALNGGSDFSGKVNRSIVTLKSGTIPVGFTANADEIVIDLTGSKTLTLADNLTVKELTGGGTISLPAGKVLTVTDSVIGTTTVALTGTISAGTTAVVAPSATDDGAFTSVTELTAVVSGTTKVWSTAAAHEHSYTDRNSGTLASGATCKTGAKYYVQCDSCNAVSNSVTVEIGAPVAHSYDNAWKANDDKHWHECIYACGTKSDEAAHVPGAEATATTPQTCTVCGYVITPATEPYIPDSAPAAVDVVLNVGTYSGTAVASGEGWRTSSTDTDIVYITLSNPSGAEMSLTPYNIVIVNSKNMPVVNRLAIKPGDATTAAGAVTAWSTGASLDDLGSGTFTVYAWGTGSDGRIYGNLGFTITIPEVSGAPTSVDVELNVGTYADAVAAKGSGWRTNTDNTNLVYITLANPTGEAMSITPYNTVIVDANGTVVVNKLGTKPDNATTAAGAVTAWSTGASLDDLGSGTFTVYAWGTGSDGRTYGKLGFSITIPDGDEPEHTHSFTTKASGQQASPATCTEAAKYYVQCDGCDEVSTTLTVSVGEPADHIPGTKWKSDKTNHWHECTADGCTAKVDEAPHIPGPAATKTKPQTCTVCGYKIAPATGGGSGSGSGGGSSSGGSGSGSAETSSLPFVDVPESFWAYDAIEWAYTKGYVNGKTATTFVPGGTVTRQQVWMILARMSGETPANMAEAKAWAVEEGVSDGTNPGNAVTRQQLVTLLWRFYGEPEADLSVLAKYADASSVAEYAREAMAWAVANGIVSGTTSGLLDPNGTATRGQFATILYRFAG